LVGGNVVYALDNIDFSFIRPVITDSPCSGPSSTTFGHMSDIPDHSGGRVLLVGLDTNGVTPRSARTKRGSVIRSHDERIPRCIREVQTLRRTLVHIVDSTMSGIGDSLPTPGAEEVGPDKAVGEVIRRGKDGRKSRE